MQKSFILVSGLSILGLSLVGVLVILDTQNSLERNGQWIPTKILLEKPVMGAEHFHRGKQALRRNRLDLGAWQGFQEVLYRDSLRLREVTFRFTLLENSYLVFEFSRRSHSSEYLGVRLSSYPRFPNAFLVIGQNGKFVEKRPIDPALLESGCWHSCHVTFNDSVCTIRIDGDYIGSATGDFALPQRIGFRSGHRNAFADDVVIEAAGGKRVVHEAFSNRKGFWVLLCVAVLVTVLIDACFFRVLRRRSLEVHHALMAVTTLNMVSLVLIGLAWGYSVFIHAKKYPAVSERLLAQERRYIEHVTQAVSQSIIDSCRSEVLSAPLVLFLGSSQTEGVGVTREGEDFVSRLRNMFGTNDSLFARCINGGISSQNSSGLLNQYLNVWIYCEPTLVVVNLGNNDVFPDEFRTNLNKFAEINRERGIATLFVTEALSVERFPEGKQTQQVMREVAREEHVPIVDMHKYLAAHSADGFLWWDHVHPTSFGHKLIAERLYPVIIKLLRRSASVPEGS